MQRITSLLVLTLILPPMSFLWAASPVLDIDAKRRFVILENDPIGTWKKGDRGCVFRESEKVGCGIIKGFSTKGAYLVLLPNSGEVKTGDVGQLMKRVRETASDDPNVLTITYESETPTKPYNLLAGMHLSLDLQYPFVEWYIAITKHMVFGIQPGVLLRKPASGSQLLGIGAAISGTYYSQGAFRGPWVQFASGFYSYSSEVSGTTDKSMSPMVTLVGGWRERWAFNTNIGAGLGVRYMPHLTDKTPTVKFRELHIIAVVDVGLEF